VNRRLKSIAAKANGGPFTEAQLRWYVHQADNNGMKDAGAVVRIGRRVFIDEEGFERWIEAQNPHLRPTDRRAQA
jgi:hypothetical protein